MKTVLVQIYRFNPDQELLNSMAEAFLRHGLQMVLWSNRDQGAIGLPIIPLTSCISDDLYLKLDDVKTQDWSRLANWQAFIDSLATSYGSVDTTYDLDRCYRVSRVVLDRLKPSLYLCWCGFEPWFAIPKELANESGIPVLVWEAGMLPDTLLLDSGGVAADSEWCGKDLPYIDSKDIESAKEYIAAWRKKEIGVALKSGPAPDGRKLPRVLILGSMDIAAGVHRVKGSGPLTLPGYADGIDMAIAVAACHSGITVYRPHPRESEGPLSRLKDANVIIDTESTLSTAILWADVVIGYGSKTDYVALALGKPFILTGMGLLTGKGCAYEALNKDVMAGVLEAAITHGMTAAQVASYERVVAWMLAQGYYNRGTGGPCRQGIQEFVAHASMYASSVESSGMVEDVLSPFGLKWLKSEHGNATPCEKGAVTMVDGDSLKEVLDRFTYDVNLAVLDFDHTLLLGNSTELFIATAKPRILAEVIDTVVKRIGCLRSTPFSDRVRVLAIALLLPWTIPLWKRSAAIIAKERWNHPLWDEIRKRLGTRIVVLSNGFRTLIKPLIQAAVGTSDIDFLIIASDLRPRGRDIRAEGKVIATQRDVSEISWEQTLVVSDSLEDHDLLVRARHGVLTLWDEPALRSEPGYFPLRYVSRGKYPGLGYVRYCIFGQDLIVWLILFGTTPTNIFSAMFLFMSFYAIYEIGYYENDFNASRFEPNPTLSAAHGHYKNYAIVKNGWAWSVLLGLAGCLLAERPEMLTVLSAWIGIIISVRLCFFVYNRKLPEQRMVYYLIMQGLKNFAGVVVLLPTLTGLLFAAAHLFQHATVYMIYRCGGDKNLFPRALCRFTLFIIGVGVVYASGSSLSLTHVTIAIAWLFYEAVVEGSGGRWTIKKVVMGAYWSLRQKSNNLFVRQHSA